MTTYNMYNYLTTMVADYTGVTLNVAPHNVLYEKPNKNQIIHEYDDDSVDVVSLTSTNYFDVTLQWDGIPEEDAGKIFDLYVDTNKANGSENTFYWEHVDGYTYVVRFMCDISRGFTHELMAGGLRSISQITLRVEGRKAV